MLKQLFPEKKYYEINGCGHRSDHVHQVLSTNQEHDDSNKCIPIENLQHKYYTELSSLFIGYIQYKYRPKDWKTYTENMIEIRKEQLSLFKVLLSTISKYNRNKLINKNDLNNVDDLLYDCYKRINNIPQLPKQAVGEWGFIREDMGNSSEFKSIDSIKENVFSPPLFTYKSYINNCRNFFSYSSFFIRNLDDTISKISSDNSKLNYLATLNMIDVLEKLSFFQSEFKKHFCGFVDLKNLRKLENEEKVVYSQLYSQCHFLSFYPTKSVTNPREYCYKYISHRFKNDLFKKLKNELNHYTNFKFKISEKLWEGQNSIWIRCEILNFDISDEEFDENMASLLTGGLLSNLLHSLYNTYDKDEIIRLLRYHWQSICLFVTYKNKVIIRSVLKQYIITSVFRDNAPFIPHLVEDKHFKEIFNLEVAHSPRIDTAFSLYESFILLKNNLSHIVELFEVIEDKSDNEVELSVKNYLEDMFNSIGDHFQKLLDFQTELLSIYNSIDEPSENFDNAMTLLFDNYKECYPEPDVETDGEFEFKIEIGLIREWRKRIEQQVSNYTIIFYLILFN